MNTELSAVVNHLAKLNDSGDVKAMTDRERRRAVDIARTAPVLAQNQRHVMKNVGEKPTDEEANKMIKETDVDDAQQRPPGMSQGDSAGAGFRMKCERNRGSYADQNTGARAESYGEAVRSSCSQHSTGANPV